MHSNEQTNCKIINYLKCLYVNCEKLPTLFTVTDKICTVRTIALYCEIQCNLLPLCWKLIEHDLFSFESYGHWIPDLSKKLVHQQHSAPVFTPIPPLMSLIPESRELLGASHLTEEPFVFSWRFTGNLV